MTHFRRFIVAGHRVGHVDIIAGIVPLIALKQQRRHMLSSKHRSMAYKRVCEGLVKYFR